MPQMQASARARWCSSSEPQLQCCSSTGPHHLEKPRPVLRVIEGGLRELNSPSAARLLPFRLLRFLVSGATSWRISFRLTRGRCAACLNTLPKGIHQVHNVCRLRPLGSFDWLAFLLLLEQLLERILVLVFELARFKVPRLRFHDVRGEIEHVLGDFLIGDVIEIVGFVPYLIRISQSDTQQSLTAGFKGNYVLTGSDCRVILVTPAGNEHGERTENGRSDEARFPVIARLCAARLVPSGSIKRRHHWSWV